MGIVRCSRVARLLAVLTRIRKIHVLIDERASKRARPCRTPTQASCTMSSARDGSRANSIAIRNILAWYVSINLTNADSLPARSALISSISSLDEETVTIKRLGPRRRTGHANRFVAFQVVLIRRSGRLR